MTGSAWSFFWYLLRLTSRGSCSTCFVSALNQSGKPVDRLMCDALPLRSEELSISSWIATSAADKKGRKKAKHSDLLTSLSLLWSDLLNEWMKRQWSLQRRHLITSWSSSSFGFFLQQQFEAMDQSGDCFLFLCRIIKVWCHWVVIENQLNVFSPYRWLHPTGRSPMNKTFHMVTGFTTRGRHTWNTGLLTLAEASGGSCDSPAGTAKPVELFFSFFFSCLCEPLAWLLAAYAKEGQTRR